MNLGENIYRLRTEKNMSQGDLADALGVSRQSVSKWETGTAVPELEKLMKMAQVFEVSLDSLVGMAAPDHPQQMPSEEKPEPRIIYVEKPVFPAFSGVQILGFVLLIVALLLAIALYNGRFSGMEILLMALPFVLCGILCLTSKHGLFLQWLGLCVWLLGLSIHTGTALGGAAFSASAGCVDRCRNVYLLHSSPPKRHSSHPICCLARNHCCTDRPGGAAHYEHTTAEPHHRLVHHFHPRGIRAITSCFS